ncbi:spore coat U domain-containing protein [Brucella tritici]|uniref:Csu type fimbrial protein n=1 Tax=Brucella tritici TaxID=94626 RepID=UPI0015927B88|nr:spore coat U domain-containing protein [Brucella tritici]
MASAAFIPVASAKTTTGKLTVKINIGQACQVTSGDNSLIDFGYVDDITHNVEAQTSDTSGIEVKCGKDIAYTIGLDDGQSPSEPGPAFRRMKSAAGNFVPYRLFKDSQRTTQWGTDPNSVKATGTGEVQKFPVYAKIFNQDATPPAGEYTDIVSVIVTY